MSRRHRVRLDGRLERIDPHLALRETHSLDESTDVRDVGDLLVMQHPGAQVGVEPVRRTLADPDHVRAGLGEPAHEFALVRRECGFDEDDVHAQILPAGSQPVPCRLTRLARTSNGERGLRRSVPAPGHRAVHRRGRVAARRPARPDQPGSGGQASRRPARGLSQDITGWTMAPTRSRSPTPPG